MFQRISLFCLTLVGIFNASYANDIERFVGGDASVRVDYIFMYSVPDEDGRYFTFDSSANPSITFVGESIEIKGTPLPFDTDEVQDEFTSSFLKLIPNREYIAVIDEDSADVALNLKVEPGYQVFVDGKPGGFIVHPATSFLPKIVSIRVVPVSDGVARKFGEASELKVADIKWKMSLGSRSNGSSAGYLSFFNETVDTNLASRTNLLYSYSQREPDEVFEAIWDDNGGLRQILVPEGIVDITDLDAVDPSSGITTGYKVRVMTNLPDPLPKTLEDEKFYDLTDQSIQTLYTYTVGLVNSDEFKIVSSAGGVPFKESRIIRTSNVDGEDFTLYLSGDDESGSASTVRVDVDNTIFTPSGETIKERVEDITVDYQTYGQGSDFAGYFNEDFTCRKVYYHDLSADINGATIEHGDVLNKYYTDYVDENTYSYMREFEIILDSELQEIPGSPDPQRDGYPHPAYLKVWKTSDSNGHFQYNTYNIVGAVTLLDVFGVYTRAPVETRLSSGYYLRYIIASHGGLSDIITPEGDFDSGGTEQSFKHIRRYAVNQTTGLFPLNQVGWDGSINYIQDEFQVIGEIEQGFDATRIFPISSISEYLNTTASGPFAFTFNPDGLDGQMVNARVELNHFSPNEPVNQGTVTGNAFSPSIQVQISSNSLTGILAPISQSIDEAAIEASIDHRLIGQPYYNLEPSGRKTSFGYASSSYSGINHAWSELEITGTSSIEIDSLWVFQHFTTTPQLDGNLDTYRNTLSEGVANITFTTPYGATPQFSYDSLDLVAGESTAKVRIYNEFGKLRHVLTYAYIDNNGTPEWTSDPIERIENEYDDFGNLKKTTSFDGAIATVTYNSNWENHRKRWDEDYAGLRTTYLYDAFDRVISSSVAFKNVSELPTSFDQTFYYDALGRQSIVLSDPDGYALAEKSRFDARGQVLEFIDTNALKTSYHYEVNADGKGRKVTTTLPGGMEEIHSFYRDGRLRSVTGSAVVPEYYTYDYDSATGMFVERKDIGYDKDSSTDHPYEIKTINGVGELSKTENSSPVTQDLISEYHYNTDTGLLEYKLESNPAETALHGTPTKRTFYEHDAFGQLERVVLDTNSNGTLELSKDRVLSDSRSNLGYKSGATGVFEIVEDRTYPIENSDTYFSAWSYNRLSGQPAGQLNELITVDYQGAETRTVTTFSVASGSMIRRTTYDDDTYSEEKSSLGLQYSNRTREGLEIATSFDSVGRAYLTLDGRGIGTVTKFEQGKMREASVTTSLVGLMSGTNPSSLLFPPAESEEGEAPNPADIDISSGNSISFTYEPDTGRLSQEIDEISGTTNYAYDLRNNVTHQWGSAVYPIKYDYDFFNRLQYQYTYHGVADQSFSLEAWPEDGDQTEYQYDDASGVLLKQIDASLRETTFTYDQLGRERTRTTPAGTDAVADPQIERTTTYYTTSGDLKSVTYDDGITEDLSYEYCRDGSLEKVTQGGREHAYVYDYDSATDSHSDLLLVSETQPTLYANLTGANAPLRHIRYNYDSTDFLGRLSGVDAGTDTQHTGYSTSFGYEASTGRINSVSHGDTSTSYGYFANTNLVQSRTVPNTILREERGYEDDTDLLSSIDFLRDEVSYARYDYKYDALKRRDDLTVSGQQVEDLYEKKIFIDFEYDHRSQVTDCASYFLHGNGTQEPIRGRDRSYTYDSIGNRLSETYDNLLAAGMSLDAVTKNYTPNALNQYTSREHADFFLISGANSAETTPTVGSANYEFVPTQRSGDYFGGLEPLSSTSPASDLRAAQYSVYQSVLDGAVDSVTGDPVDSLSEQSFNDAFPPREESFTYDARGNLKSDAFYQYTWDAENRLIGVETIAAAITAGKEPIKLVFRYDYLSRRIAEERFAWEGAAFASNPETVRRLIWEDWHLIEDSVYTFTYNASDAVTATTRDEHWLMWWGPDWGGERGAMGGVGGLACIQYDGAFIEKLYPVYDGSANIIAYLDHTGASYADYEYSPYGELVRQGGSLSGSLRFRFSTKYNIDGLDLHDYGYRFYSPDLGRFISRDPIGESGGINLYAFVNNNPVNSWDMLGMVDWSKWLPWNWGERSTHTTYYSGWTNPQVVTDLSNGWDFSVTHQGNSALDSTASFFGDAGSFFGDVASFGLGYIGDGFGSIANTMSNGYFYPGSTERFAQTTSAIVGGSFQSLSQLSYDAQYALNGLAYGDLSGFGQMANNFIGYEQGDTPGETGAKIAMAFIGRIKLLDDLPTNRTTYHTVTNSGAGQGVLNGINPKFLNPDSRFGKAFYISDDAGTTLAELAHHGATGSHTIRYNLNLSKANVLDLTNPSIAKSWGYSGGPISPATQAIGTNAIDAGFDVIKFPSMRGPGTNYGVLSNFDELLTPQMIVPTP